MLMAWPRFVGFDELHLPQAFLKQSFEEAWSQDGDILDATCRHMVRSDLDVNQWLIRERQLAEGKFIACSPKRGSVFRLDLDAEQAVKTVRRQEVPMVCLNDGDLTQERFLQIQEDLTNAFSAILPEVSCFEREAEL